MVVLSVPVGLLTDRMRRDSLLRVSGGLGVLASLAVALALWLDAARHAAALPALYAAAFVNGAFNAVNGPPLAALFADSTASGGTSDGEHANTRSG